MPNEECPSCSGHPKMDCIRDHFSAKLAKLLHDTLEEVQARVLEDSPEVNDRKESFPLELADHLLWLAASIYVGEGVPSSEAIYELAKALEELDSESDGEATDPEPQRPKLVSNNDVN